MSSAVNVTLHLLTMLSVFHLMGTNHLQIGNDKLSSFFPFFLFYFITASSQLYFESFSHFILLSPDNVCVCR